MSFNSNSAVSLFLGKLRMSLTRMTMSSSVTTILITVQRFVISFFDHGVVVIQCLNYILFLFLRRLFLLLQESKKFKRLKKARRDTDEDRYGFSDEEFDGSGKGGRTAEEKLKRSLFGDDEGNTFEILPRL